MSKTGPLPPEYSVHDNAGYEASGGSGAFPAPAEVMTPEQARDLTPPPAYDTIFYRREVTPPKPSKKRDYRSMWDKVHEWFEDSIFQLLIWLAALTFAIVYIYKSIKNSGKCHKYKLKDEKKTEQEDLAGWMKVEGGVMCATVAIVLLLRLLELLDRRRTNRIMKSDLEGRKKCGANLFFLCCGLFIANFALCMIGASKVFSFYDNINNKTVICDDSYYNYYYDAKIGQVVVFAAYAAYIVLGLFCAVPISKKAYIRRKWRFFANLLDADMDGIISQDDMKKTMAKFEVIRKSIGDRKTQQKEVDQNKLWNDHVFKRGPNKDISVEEYVTYLEGVYDPAGMANKMRPFITGLFNAFSTDEFRKKQIIFSMEDFVTFWKILADVDGKHCKKIFIRNFLNPLTMSCFLEEFVRLVSLEDFFDEDSLRIFLILKPSNEPDPCIDRVCRPSCCNV